MSRKTLLCVVAHPDDETFGAGGMLVHAVAQGAKVVTVCATRGEAGEIMERSGATPETLPRVREQEYRNAGEIMGVSESVLLGYRDSGMPGTPENDDSGAFIQQPEQQVVGDIVEVIDRVRPDVLLTMEPGGGYGHPDHIFASRCTLAAFNRVRTRVGSGWSPKKLYYFTFPRSQMKRFADEMALNDPGSPMAQLDPSEMGTPDELITLTLKIPDHLETLRRAYAAHVSQISPLERVSEEVSQEFMQLVSLVRIFPEGAPGDETDIFDGI